VHRPAVVREDRLDVLHALIRARPLGALVTAGDGALEANHLPFLIEETEAGLGVLRAHAPRAYGQLAALRAGGEALVIFQGPEAYVTPAWYPSKAEHGKVVPTWNYVVVHAWGAPRVIEDAGWIRSQIERLTAAQEASRPHPWAVSDAPEGFVAGLIGGIVGLEIPIARLEGKWKVSQNRPEADRLGVAAGLEAEGETAMARLVADWGRED
jgi:transcriptional regulator